MPAVPVKQYSFTDFQVNHPASPPPGDRLDAELARLNKTITAIIAWVNTSLNTDGTLRHGVIGKNELKTGAFDDLGTKISAEAQRIVMEGLAAAKHAGSAAGTAQMVLQAAITQAAIVQDCTARADIDAKDAASDARDAASSAAAAAASAEDAANSAGNADGSEAVCTDYGVLTQAWAEHMPDTIPPNILAVMDVTGDHWSSRWWANQAHLIVENDTAEAICELQHYWMGAYPTPPTHNTCGDPVVAGAMYWDLTEQVCKVYDGNIWHDVTQLAPGQVDEFLYLPATPTTVFTGVDYHGNTLKLDPANAVIAVYVNGIRLVVGRQYTVTTNSVTLMTPVTTPSTVEIIDIADATTRPPPIGVKVNTSLWVFDGVIKTFPLQDSNGVTIDPPGAVDCIVSIDGVIQESGGDFTVRTGFIDFIVAPYADADKWMVIGIPLGGAAASVLVDGVSIVGTGMLIPLSVATIDGGTW
jgi:hypothetical protein